MSLVSRDQWRNTEQGDSTCEEKQVSSLCPIPNADWSTRMTMYEYRLSFLHHDNGVSSIAIVGEFGWQST
jgi:hypothetical protein